MAKNNQNKVKRASFFTSRKFKYGSVATALTAVFVAVVIIVNVIFSLLSDAYSWKIDMTSYDLYSMSDSTREIVNALTEDDEIKLTVMYNEEEFYEQFRETIKRFANLSEQITCTYVDPDVNPQALTAYGAEYSIEKGAVVVENGDRIRVVSLGVMYEYDTSTGIATFRIEESLGSAVLYVTKEEIPLIYFITGHGETGYDSFMNMIANNGAEVKEVKLSQLNTFDAQARVMVICGPTMDYSEKEIYQLQQFLANDYGYERDLFFFGNPAVQALPNLEAFLAEWGLALGHDLVMETDEYSASSFAPENTGTAPLYLMPSYTGAEVSGTAITADYLSVVPNASSIKLLFETSDITETTALLTTSEGSYAKSGSAVNTVEKEETDATGPFNVAAIATRFKYENNIEVSSHVFAAGSVDMLNSLHMTYNVNSNFLLRVYQMMVGETESEIVGTSKMVAANYMTMDTATIRIASIIFIGVIPGLFLVIGLIVYIRRRYL